MCRAFKKRGVARDESASPGIHPASPNINRNGRAELNARTSIIDAKREPEPHGQADALPMRKATYHCARQKLPHRPALREVRRSRARRTGEVARQRSGPAIGPNLQRESERGPPARQRERRGPHRTGLDFSRRWVRKVRATKFPIGNRIRSPRRSRNLPARCHTDLPAINSPPLRFIRVPPGITTQPTVGVRHNVDRLSVIKEIECPPAPR
jgi:hypothetical protein